MLCMTARVGEYDVWPAERHRDREQWGGGRRRGSRGRKGTDSKAESKAGSLLMSSWTADSILINARSFTPYSYF